MILKKYIDIEPYDNKSAQAMSALLTALHRSFDEVGGFALAFPRIRSNENPWVGGVIRVFMSSSEGIEKLVELLEKNSLVANKVRFMFAKSIPDNFKGDWVNYSRVRVPSLSDVEKSRTNKAKARETRLSSSNTVPYFRLLSKSTGQLFSLMVVAKKTAPFGGEVFPTSYGLSSENRPFSVPEIK
ncbi:MAG: hypothetical protein CTY38_01190 [Methylotenera sp.]|uniref:type I-F CRISPR-associated endoribonuclease Cas6/Csy4 n=1 Tax=Methylotenera sp. TaxID=2051956 RepID=UPI000D460E6E|nr:type I-F CRISPR-associated endoribonuclease Cas6/Csy4 [Methylotenera sp.]PPC84691.1 MAG: hypothetical protein CTY38_01190 [Methylotenera sp.]